MAGSETEKIISQFADDTALFLIYNEKCINEALHTLVRIEASTGLKVSYEKTCIYCIGSLKDTNAKCYTIKPIKWSDGDIDLLGISIRNQAAQDGSGYDPIFAKIENVSATWGNRNLTIIGKTLLVNTLMSSLLMYRLAVLPPISEAQTKKYYEIVHNFMWGKKRAKIPLKILQNEKDAGGLRLINIQHQQRGLHIAWVKKIHDCPDKWSYVYELLCPKIGQQIWECNIKDSDVQSLRFPPSHWTNILRQWTKVHFYAPTDKAQVESQIIWYKLLC